MTVSFDYTLLIQRLQDTLLERWALQLSEQIAERLTAQRNADIPRWQTALQALPEINVSTVELNTPAVTAGTAQDCGEDTRAMLEEALRGLHPWRKGPFDICGVNIDTEWRSDFKWDRLKHAIEPLQGHTVLDVGCGSGYHCWRIAGAGAELVVGIDPTPLFIFQYWAVQKYLQDQRVWVVPQRLEELPAQLCAFDSIFSMGILYHRRSPLDHLLELREALRPGGQLVLETLVIEGGEGEALVPEGRYSKLGNVWFVPTCATLCSWLRKMKFEKIDVVDVTVTTSEEQRTTDWMKFQSLSDFLDPQDARKTIEGYPAPRRAIVTAKKKAETR
ncbi:MAG: tRNA 5-methoxyuridine(34)/uridine 5-oxyacetic acid(34) synthase CmoB [Pseudomonadales bacterium]